jgi:hypothetical protein
VTSLTAKDYKPLLKHLAKQGVNISENTKGYFLKLPNGQTMHLHKTLSDWRAANNVRARLKAAGISWPGDVTDKPVADWITKAKMFPSTIARYREFLGDPLPDRVVVTQVAAGIKNPNAKLPDFSTAYKALYALGYRPGTAVGPNHTKPWMLVVDDEHPEITRAKLDQQQPAELPPADQRPASVPLPPTGAREILDTMDSWPLDIKTIHAVPVGVLLATLKSSGLRMEIRVWRDPDFVPPDLTGN